MKAIGKNLENYLTDIDQYITQRIKNLEDGNIEELTEQILELYNRRKIAEPELKDTYEAIYLSFITDLKDSLTREQKTSIPRG